MYGGGTTIPSCGPDIARFIPEDGKYRRES
jgi:hypothetical protein